MKIKTFIKLGDICDISAGQGAPQGDSNYCDNGTPFVKAGNLIELLQGKNETDIQKVSEDVAKKHKLKKYTAGSILFAKSGMSCMKGYVYQLKNDSYVVSHLAIVKPIKDSSDYIEYCLRHIKPNSLVKDEAYPSISLQDISNLKIPLPSLEEQIKISKQLYICTQIINKHKKQLERYDTLIKSRFIEMFGDIRNQEKYKGIPLSNLCKTMTGGTPPTSKPEYYEGTIPWITTVSLGPNHIDGKNAKGYITEEAIKNSATKLIPVGNILFGTRVGVGKSSINDVDICTNQDIIALIGIDESRYSKLFIKHVLDQYQPYFDSIKKGATILGITTDDVKKSLIPDVSLSLQKEFENFVQQIDKSKFAVQKSLEKAETLYKSLMQEYFA